MKNSIESEERRKQALLARMRSSRRISRSVQPPGPLPPRRAEQIEALLAQLDQLPRTRGGPALTDATRRAIERALLPQYEFPWYSNTHETLADLALQRMPEFVQRLVALHKGFFVLGVVAPDKLFKDSVNHVYHVTAARTGQGFVGYGPSKIGKKCAEIRRMLQEPGQVLLGKQSARFLQGIATRPCQLLAFELGVLSH